MHGVAWFSLEDYDPMAVALDETLCRGWHFCCYDNDHEGDHMCRHGHFCPQEEKDAEEAENSARD